MFVPVSKGHNHVQLENQENAQDRSTKEISTILNNISTTLSFEAASKLDEIARQLEHLEEISELTKAIKEELSYGLPRVVQEIYFMWTVSTVCMVVGLIAIVGTLRHWF
jgi:hypothetical protein